MRHYTISTLRRGEIWYNLHMAVAKIEYKKEFFDRDYTLKEAYQLGWITDADVTAIIAQLSKQ